MADTATPGYALEGYESELTVGEKETLVGDFKVIRSVNNGVVVVRSEGDHGRVQMPIAYSTNEDFVRSLIKALDVKLSV